MAIFLTKLPSDCKLNKLYKFNSAKFSFDIRIANADSSSLSKQTRLFDSIKKQTLTPPTSVLISPGSSGWMKWMDIWMTDIIAYCDMGLHAARSYWFGKPQWRKSDVDCESSRIVLTATMKLRHTDTWTENCPTWTLTLAGTCIAMLLGRVKMCDFGRILLLIIFSFILFYFYILLTLIINCSSIIVFHVQFWYY